MICNYSVEKMRLQVAVIFATKQYESKGVPNKKPLPVDRQGSKVLNQIRTCR